MITVESSIRVSEDGRGLALIDVVHSVRDSRLYDIRLSAVTESRFGIDVDRVSFYEESRLYVTKEGLEILRLVAYQLHWYTVYERLGDFIKVLDGKEI